MLIIDPNQTFDAKVVIKLRGFNASFGVRCKLLHLEELNKLYKEWTGEPATEEKAAVPPTLGDADFIGKWLVGFADDVQDVAGHPLPFTPANVAQVLNLPGARVALIRAFLDGYQETETKN